MNVMHYVLTYNTTIDTPLDVKIEKNIFFCNKVLPVDQVLVVIYLCMCVTSNHIRLSIIFIYLNALHFHGPVWYQVTVKTLSEVLHVCTYITSNMNV